MKSIWILRICLHKWTPVLKCFFRIWEVPEFTYIKYSLNIQIGGYNLLGRTSTEDFLFLFFFLVFHFKNFSLQPHWSCIKSSHKNKHEILQEKLGGISLFNIYQLPSRTDHFTAGNSGNIWYETSYLRGRVILRMKE